MEGLSRRGFETEVVCGTIVDSGPQCAVSEFLISQGDRFAGAVRDRLTNGPGAGQGGDSPRVSLECSRVPITIHDARLRPYDEPTDLERGQLLRLAIDSLDRSRPDVLLVYGGDPITAELLALARRRGISSAFAIHNFHYRHPELFTRVDHPIVPSRFAANFYARALGLECTVLPNLADADRCRVVSRDPKFLTFVNPSVEKGVYAFARISDELGRRRPDIPILVVESRGTEATVAACGLELREHGNVFFMAHTSDPREFWGVTRACLLPSLWWENQPLVAVEAMINGIPVIGSDRGGIPETLGGAGIVLPLPDRITPATRMLPTAEEVEPWVRAVIRLWDDPEFYEDHRKKALAESRRWDPDVLEPLYVEFFRGLKPGPRPAPVPARAPTPAPAPAVDRPAGRTIEEGIEAIRRRWPDLGDDCEDEPVFILASGWRSGSTMLQRLAFGRWFVWGEPFGHAGLVESMAGPLRCFTDRWPEPHHFREGRDAGSLGREFIANLHPPVHDLREAHRAYFRALFAEPARRAGVSRWGFKEVRLDVDHAIYLKWLFPRAKFLFLIRDPYDAWRSFAARARKGWKWYNRWPDEPVTARSFAAHWRRLASSFRSDHAKVGGIVVRYESLARGEYGEIEGHLGSPLSREAGQVNPRDGGPPPLPEIDPADLEVLDEELGALASTLGYHPGRRGAPAVPGPAVAPAATPAGPSPGRAGSVVLVPHLNGIDWECEEQLRKLETAGVRVVRSGGNSAIDVARNRMASEALHDGAESIFFIDSDIGFDPLDALRLLARPEPVVCGVYAKKGRRQVTSVFADGVEEVVFGARSFGLYPLKYAATGFLRIRATALRRMIEELGLPLCNTGWGRGEWPFFRPTVVPTDQGGHHYLGEDWAFSHRLARIGLTPMADTSIRLWHYGRHPFGWEEAGIDPQRHPTFTYRLGGGPG